MNDFAILINTCDNYSDAWEGFFRLLKIVWPDLSYKIYLNTESKFFSYPGFDITCINLPTENLSAGWGFRLKNALLSIKERYVLMLLEDFYFDQAINTFEVSDSIQIIKENKNIASILLSEIDINIKTNFLYGKFYIRKNNERYLLNTSPALWDKDVLIEYTFDNDTPWTWEFFGSLRLSREERKFLAYNVKKYGPIFSYDIKRGGAIHRGKWVGCNIEYLQDKYKFRIDIGSRPVIYDWTIETKHEKRNFFRIFRNRWKMMQNFLWGLFHSISNNLL